MDRTHRRGYDRDYDYDRRYSRDYERGYDSPGDRGFFDRAADEVRSWFGDDEAERRRHRDERYGRQEDRYDRGYGREVYPGRTADWDDEARRHYASGRYFYESRNEDRDYDRGFDRDYGYRADYDRDYNRRYARDFGDHRGTRGAYERTAGFSDYDRYAGRDDRYGSSYDRDYDRGYRTGASGRYPDYDTNRALRDLDRNEGFRGRSYGYNRRSETAY